MHKFALIYSAIGECYVGLVQHIRKMNFKEAVAYFGEKCDKSAAKMASVFKAMGEAIVEIAKNAQSANAGDFGTSAIVVTGSFSTSRGPWTFGKNFLQIVLKVGEALKAGLKAITPRVIREDIVPAITSIFDAAQGWFDSLKRGDTISIAGDDLAPDTEKDDEGVWLRLKVGGNGDPVGTEYPCEVTSSELQLVKFTCPGSSTIGIGNYDVVVRTRCGFGDTVSIKTVSRYVLVAA